MSRRLVSRIIPALVVGGCLVFAHVAGLNVAEAFVAVVPAACAGLLAAQG